MDRTEGSKRIVSILMDKDITEWRDVLVRMMDECRRQIEEIDAQAERVEFDNITHILVWLGAKKTDKDTLITMDGIGMKRPDWPTNLRFSSSESKYLTVGRLRSHRKGSYTNEDAEELYSISDVDTSRLYEFIVRDNHVKLASETRDLKVWYTIIGDLFFVAESRLDRNKWRRGVSVMTKERLIHVSKLKLDTQGKPTLEIEYILEYNSFQYNITGTITITNADDIAEIKNWTLL